VTIDDTALDGLRSTLAADDYRLAVTESGSGVEVRITAGPHACAECLVPKPIMRAVLGPALGVPEDAIALIYPADADDGP
jgi:hypothetical protein